MSIPHAVLFDFDFFEPLPIQVEVSEAPLTSDAGLLPLRQFDERIALTKQFAAVLDGPREPGQDDSDLNYLCFDDLRNKVSPGASGDAHYL